jgi:hypothetical protein
MLDSRSGPHITRQMSVPADTRPHVQRYEGGVEWNAASFTLRVPQWQDSLLGYLCTGQGNNRNWRGGGVEVVDNALCRGDYPGICWGLAGKERDSLSLSLISQTAHGFVLPDTETRL